jgi:hypothetical protein
MLDPGWARNAFAPSSALSFLSLPLTLDLWVALIAPPVFFLKKRRMPVCEFRIDGQGIERTSRLGTFERSWDDVKMVRRYEPRLPADVRQGRHSDSLPLPGPASAGTAARLYRRARPGGAA